MIKKFGRTLLFLLAAVLILNFNHYSYAEKESLVTPSGLTKSELTSSIESYIDKHRNTTAGLAISVFNDQEELYLGYHGYGDLEKQVPVLENTVFEWGSISKLLTWVSIYQLCEEDRIDLDEDI